MNLLNYIQSRIKNCKKKRSFAKRLTARVKMVTGLFCLLLISPFSAMAEVVSLSNVQGEAMVFSMTGSGWEPAKQGMELALGDNLKTGPGASVTIQFGCQCTAILKNKGALAVTVGSDGTSGVILFEAMKMEVSTGFLTIADANSGDIRKLKAGESFRQTKLERIDDHFLKMSPIYTFDFTNPDCWPKRDGITRIDAFKSDKKPVIKLSLGDGRVIYSSRFIHKEVIDFRKAPFLDMYVRTKTDGPVSILFHAGNDSKTWYQLPIHKKNPQFPVLDNSISVNKKLNDGKWHRLTWNLKKIIQKKFGTDVTTISQVIIGKWTEPESVAELEIKSFGFGKLTND